MKAFNKDIKGLEQDYSKSMKPYKKHRRVVNTTAGIGAGVGLLAGIPKSEILRVFDLFKRVGKQDVAGEGVGLP